MEIILTRSEITEENIENLRTALAAEDARSNDMLIPNAEDVKVGNIFVRVKVGGLWYNWSRRPLRNIVIDGTLYPLHGDEFLRINCVTSQEELAAAKQDIDDTAKELKDNAQKACDEIVSDIDTESQRRKDRLDKEFMLQVG